MQVLEFGSSAEKVSLALKVSSENLGIVTGLRTDDIINQRSREKFIEYLKSLHLVHSSKVKEGGPRDALEQSTFRRDIKRRQLREQRLKDQHGSQLTYLGESSQDKSRIAQERLHLSQARPSMVMSDTDSLDNTRHELGEFTPVSPMTKVMLQNETLSNTQRQLNELEKELRLLQLERGVENHGYKRHSQFSAQDNSLLGLRASNGLRKPTNLRQELRQVHRNGSLISGILGQRETQEPVRSSDLFETSAYGNFHGDHVDGNDGKLPFGGCYLSEPPGGFNDSRKHNLERDSLEESVVFKDYQVEPSVLNKTRSFTPHKSSETVVIPEVAAVQTSFLEETRISTPHNAVSQSRVNSNSPAADDHRLIPKSSMETKGISKLFDVDFCDLDSRKRNDQENRAVERMIQAGNRYKLDSRDAELSASRGTVIVNDEIGKSLKASTPRQRLGTVDRTLRHGLRAEGGGTMNLNGEMDKALSFSTDQDKREPFGKLDGRPRDKVDTVLPAYMSPTNVNGERAKPLISSPSSKSEYKLNKGIRETLPETSSRDSSEPARHLKRTFSKEKRPRERVLARKSARNTHPATAKTHVHALTTLIRMSAKNANASCSEED